jgi:uncharacterized protein YozE (UPF0346 family)
MSIQSAKFSTVAEVLATYPDFSILGAQKFVPKSEFPVTAENFQQYRNYCEFSQDYFFNLWQDFDAATSRDVREVKAGKCINTTIVSTHRGDITLADYIADCQKLWAQHQATFIQLANERHEAEKIEEVAQIQEAVEFEEAILENETPVFVGLEFAETETPEADTFIINKRGYAYLNGKYTYQWGSYEYVLGSYRGSDVCVQGVIIAEHIETVEEAYEIAKKHYQNWVASQPAPTRTETVIELSQKEAETPTAPTAIDPYLAERPIDETITANEFYSYADPETLTDEQINSLFDYHTTPKNDMEFWDISVGKTLYRFAFYDSGEYSLWLETNPRSEEWLEFAEWDSLKPDFTLTHAQIMREAYTLIYKDLCQISPFAPRETIINLESDKGLSDMQVREIEKSLLIGINTAENFIIYNARAEYDTKAGRWLCIGKDHKAGKKLQGYIDACKIVQPYKQTL